MKIKEGTIKFAAEIPGELLGDIKPGDILEFPVTVYIEHNSEEVVMKGKTLVFVGYPEEIAGEEINELSDSRIIPWNSFIL